MPERTFWARCDKRDEVFCPAELRWASEGGKLIVDTDSPLMQEFLRHIEVFFKCFGTHWHENGFYLADTVRELKGGSLAGIVCVGPDKRAELLLFR